jgi:hypothetical protein
MSEALLREVERRRMLKLLDEMEAESPMTPAGRAAGERLWKLMSSCACGKRRLPRR